MEHEKWLIIADYKTDSSLTLQELCEICQVSTDFIHTLISYEIIQPKHEMPGQFIFDITMLYRLQRALRLQKELELNLVGTAVILDLLEQIEELENKMNLLEKHY